jgi:uncharacterized protein
VNGPSDGERSTLISEKLLDVIRREYVLDWHGIHGIEHFRRVRDSGLRLARITRAQSRVVELFAFLHDSMRVNDSDDPGHGCRAAEFVRSLQGDLFVLSDSDCNLLAYACEFHTAVLTEADPTVQTCWDADRLDLGRAGIVPAANKLCTKAAQDPEIMKWAYDRSISQR